MTHIRTTLRTAVREALNTAFAAQSVQFRRDYWSKVNVKQLPRGGVGTPGTQNAAADTHAVERNTDILVVLKREAGDEIEDILDADSILIETTAMGVFLAHASDFGLYQTQVTVDAKGDAPIGELSMLFRAGVFTPEGDPETII